MSDTAMAGDRCSTARSVLILGLRRSGTTAFWRAIRQGWPWPAYDEPFSASHARLPAPDAKETNSDLRERFAQDPARFWAMYRPIPYEEELLTGLSDRQADYLRWLTERGPTLLDLTRCHFKLDALVAAVPNAVVVHLHRDPRAWITSHVLPSGSSVRGRLRRRQRRRNFFNSDQLPANWGADRVLRRDPKSAFGLALARRGADPLLVQKASAITRMMAYWRLAGDVAEEWGRRADVPFHSVSYESFLAAPLRTVSAVVREVGLTVSASEEYGWVRGENRIYRPLDDRWSGVDMTLEQAGLPMPRWR